MLLPIHFSVPPEIGFADGDDFQVIWYSKFRGWYVITWEHIRRNDEEGAIGGNIGQSVWENRQLKGWDWFGLNIGQFNEKQDRIARLSADPRTRINKNTGKYGIPPIVANRLFESQNRVWFQSKRWD